MTAIDTTIDIDIPLMDAVRAGRLTSWMAATRGCTDVLALQRDIAQAIPHLAPSQLAVVVEHPACMYLAGMKVETPPFLTDALNRGHQAWLETLTQTQWFTAHSFVTLVEQALTAPNADPRLVSTALAIAADNAIAQKRWSDYADGLTRALSMGHIGALAWASHMDLPVEDCLPLRESLSRLHGSGVDEAVFRLVVLVANARTSHQKLRVQKILAKADATAEGALLGPNTALRKACLALPTVAPSVASIAAR